MMKCENCRCCPYAVVIGNVNLRSCSVASGVSRDVHRLIECAKRPELGVFEPTISTDSCPVWLTSPEIAVDALLGGQ